MIRLPIFEPLITKPHKMKQLFFALTLLFTINAFAQEPASVTPSPILNKKGHPILPEAKDWSIGFDANFIIDYFGNLFNNSTTNPGGRPGYLSPNTIIVKYMKTDKLAYLGMVRIGNVASTVNAPIADQLSTGSPKFITTDTWKNDSMNIRLGVGFQKFRGRGRLQGVYGATVEMGYSRKKDTYSYGNKLDETHPLNFDTASSDQNTTVFPTGITGIDNVGAYGRVTESKSGSLFAIGVRGFLGIEYFFATKMSLGAQYGWGIAFASMSEGEFKAENLDLNNDLVVSTGKTNDLSSFYVDVDNGEGQISLNFYF
jgi:hypothetical protein